MCGIAGLVSFQGILDEDFQSLTNITNALVHRGPDFQKCIKENAVAFGHARLSIIDLSEEANQPMYSADKTCLIVFNGEIYNHAEIRKELEAEFKFKTKSSDTEVVLNAYKKWGIDCLNRFKGMFAFALYDLKENSIYLVRDHLGKKPLYYTSLGDKLFFASEINALFANKTIKKEISDDAIYHYLSMLTTPEPNTFFKNIFKLGAGSYIKIEKNKKKEIRYWYLKEFYKNEKKDSKLEAVQRTEELMEQAIKRRFVADVPISIALSGGLDSSLNAYYAAKHNVKVNAINLKYSDYSEFDESSNAKKLANELGIPFHSIEIDKEGFGTLINEYLQIQKDMPIGDPNFPLLYYIAQYAKSIGSKVLIVGEGGDEIGGYPVYQKIYEESKKIKRFPYLKFFLSKNILGEKYDYWYKGRMISRRHIHGFRQKLKDSFWLKEKPEPSSYEILDKMMHAIETKDIRAKVNAIDYFLRLPDLILPRVDYPTMATSIEARSPFLDTDWIEYNVGLPFSIKMEEGSKTIIKKIASEKLPSYILEQKKVGFGKLLSPFLNTTLLEWYKNDIINNEEAPIKEYIKHQFLTKLLENQQRTKKEGFRLWVIFALNKWLEVNR